MRIYPMMVLSLLVSLPVAAEPIRVAGRVLDLETQAGMAGAWIEIFPAWEPYEQALRRLEEEAAQKPLATARPRPDGSFEIAAPEAGLFRLVVRAEGRLTVEHPLVPLVEETALPEVPLPPRPQELLESQEERFPGWWPADAEWESRTTKVRVQVRDGDGKPVAGAVVRRNGQAVARTGPEGRLEIAIPKDASLIVEGQDGWRARVAAPEGDQAVTVRLQPSRTIAGRVVDALSRRPLSGALVWIGRPPVASPVRSGDDGAFRIAIPAGEEPSLEAVAAGYTPLSARPVKPGEKEPVVLALEPSAGLSGIVVNGEGRPVPGARITADPPRDRVFPAQPISARSGDDGRFRLTGLRPSGAYRLQAEHEGFARAEVTTRTAPAGQTSEAVRIVMGKGQTASGRVVDDRGQPVAGVMVALFRMTGEGSKGVSDQEGKFEIPRLNPGEYELLLAHPDSAPVHRRGIEIPPGQPVVDLGDVELSSGGVIEGRVVDGQGTPVAGAKISVFPTSEDRFSVSFELSQPFLSSQSPPGDIETAEDGAFRVPGLQRGVRHHVIVQHPGYVDATLHDIEAPTAEPLRIVLRPGRSLAGQVVGPAGEPVARAGISLVEEIQIGDSRSSSSRSLAATDREGRFRVEGLPPGALTLEVEAADYLRRRVDGLLLPEDRDLGDLKIVLERGFQLEVQVLNAQGEPASDTLVQAEPEPGTGSPDPRESRGAACLTDSRGRCRISVPRTGVYNLQVMAQGASVAARVEAVGGITPVEIRLPAGVEVSGRVIGEDGIPVGMAFVELKSASGELNGVVEADGSFRFSDILDGQYNLSAIAPLTNSSSADLEVTVAGRPVRDLELRVQKGGAGTLLTGRVLGLEPGERRDVSVTAFPEPPGSGDRFRSGQVSPQGDYRISDLRPGEWTVSAHAPTGRSTNGNVRIEPGVRAVTLDLEFPPRGSRLSGRVLVDGLPLPNALIQGRRGSAMVVQGTSAHDGSFAVDVQEPGAIALLIGGPQGIGAARSMQVGDDMEITVDIRTGRLRGTVTGPAGEPIEGSAVRVEGWSPELQAVFFSLTLRGGPDGAFEVPRLAAGTVRISVQAPGFAASESLTEIPPGGEEVVEIRLGPLDQR
ncbi:MAG TPA: carboxypeptidase regulatory-like domain-containing protein [Thermoanaerobaculia bacterium]